MVLCQENGHLILENTNYFEELFCRIVLIQPTHVLNYDEYWDQGMSHTKMVKYLRWGVDHAVIKVVMVFVFLREEAPNKVGNVDQKVPL